MSQDAASLSPKAFYVSYRVTLTRKMTRKFLRVILFDAQMAILHLRVILHAFMMRYPPHRQGAEVSPASLASR